MSTESIFRSVYLSPEEAIAFLNALEESAKAPEKKVDVSCREMTREEVRIAFGGKHGKTKNF